LTLERIEPETLRRSTLPSPKPIPLGQPKWVILIYLLKSKDNPFEAFKELKVRTEFKTNRRIKNLRNDNGLELCGEFYN